jgi:hypothetical protein
MIPDNYDLFALHDREQARYGATHCRDCGKELEPGEGYEIDGDVYCEECHAAEWPELAGEPAACFVCGGDVGYGEGYDIDGDLVCGRHECQAEMFRDIFKGERRGRAVPERARATA